ncbi:uncharacterized protein BDV14DRAFT_202761 [Aspergillus stella-maris]|uniref:uncharacterized protein n=1 Tax=Aspergillus stella-maris TaxID=1810926 RepID=UPI003CCD83C8
MSDTDSVPEWRPVKKYTDHLGYQVVLEQSIESGYEPEGCFLVPIQVYSLFPLDEDHTQLREYLIGSRYDVERLPLFEFYSYLPPNAYACINHNRREIAYRKQQHRAGEPNPPPLIPQFLHRGYEHPMGCCVLLRSQSYRFGYDQDESRYTDGGAEGPLVVWFNRSFSATRAEVDRLQCKRSTVQGRRGRMRYPEAFELSIEHERGSVSDTVYTSMFWGATDLSRGVDFLEFALDVDEGEPSSSGPLSEQGTRLRLQHDLAAGSYQLPPAFRVSHDANTLTITNTPEGAQSESDIQYPIHASFLSHLPMATALDLLQSTARLFTAALVPHLPPSKSITFKFCIPETDSWAAILPAQTKAFGEHSNKIAIGALQTFSPAPWKGEPTATYRVSPQDRKDSVFAPRQQLDFPYRVFAIVLDRPNFVSEAGVYFFMTDRQGVWYGRNLEVWRCAADVALIARRLAMVAREEGDVDEDRSFS